MQSGAIVFRESDKRLPSYSAGNLDAEIRSRPATHQCSRGNGRVDPQKAYIYIYIYTLSSNSPYSFLRSARKASAARSRPQSAAQSRLAIGDGGPDPWRYSYVIWGSIRAL